MNLLKLAAAVAVGVSRYANPIPRARYGAEWDESKHPRGNAKNAGQFTAGQSVKVGDSVGSKIKGGSVGKIVSGPHSIGGVTGQYLVDHNGVQEHHHGSRLKAHESADASPQKADLSQQAKTLSTIAEGHSQRAEQAKPGDVYFAQLHATAADAHKTAARAHSAANKAGFQAHPVLKGHHATLAWRHETMAASHEGATSAQGGHNAADLVKDQKSEDTTAPPPGGYSPDPAQGKAARVGVPGDVVPPPPKKIPRLNNLNPEERAVESKFAEMFEKDPDGLADQFIAAMANRSIGDGPNIFATDESKMLFPDWKGTKVPVMENGQPKIGKDGKPEMELSPETKAFRSKYNTAMHQTANAIAKRAFIRYLDTEVAKMPNKSILVTAGGVAAGKGYAIDNVDAVKSISNKASATWDSAGEQNSTELEWLASECQKRGIKMTAVFVHSNPTETWENPDRGVIERAGKKGRMVDARPFADSYTHGAMNFHKFQQAHSHDDAIQTMVLDNTRPPIPDMDENGVQKLDKKGKPAMKADIQYLPQVPQEMLSMSPEHLYARCMDALAKAPAPDAVKEGGSAGARIWPEGQAGGSAQKPGQNVGK